MNEYYQKALSKGIAIAYGANGDAFMRAYRAMTADMTKDRIKRRHRQSQKVTVKGIFRGAVMK